MARTVTGSVVAPELASAVLAHDGVRIQHYRLVGLAPETTSGLRVAVAGLTTGGVGATVGAGCTTTGLGAAVATVRAARGAGNVCGLLGALRAAVADAMGAGVAAWCGNVGFQASTE
jgi:hypothetical protein